MADNNNQDPFGHPIKKNNWWLYILGGLCFAGLIAWFFIDWSYKDRHDTPEEELPKVAPVPVAEPQLEKDDTLPQITVEAEAPAENTAE